jgi:uncharacterized protein YndB with AHSA1/START domain
MKSKLLSLIILLCAASNATAQQRLSRTAKPLDTGPVIVMRSTTLQVPIASDAVSVFSYLTDPAKITTWLADQAILEPKFGGKYHYRWKNQDPVDGVVTEYIAANTLALTWKHPTDDAETQVKFKLSPQGGETLVELEHRGFASAADLEMAVKLWVFYLENLKSVIENQTDMRTPVKPAVRTRPR